MLASMKRTVPRSPILETVKTNKNAVEETKVVETKAAEVKKPTSRLKLKNYYNDEEEIDPAKTIMDDVK